jgi:hypothetical protein
VDAGARNIDFIIDRTVLPDASRALLQKMAEGVALPAALVLGLDASGGFTYTFTDEPASVKGASADPDETPSEGAAPRRKGKKSAPRTPEPETPSGVPPA